MVIVIIGLGSIAGKHINAIRNIDAEAKIYALRSLAGEKNTVNNVHNIFSFEEIKLLSPDFIIISNPTICHLESIKECIQLKVPLFIEKPAFHTLDGIDEILKCVESNQIKTYVACNLRFLESIEFAKNIIEKKKNDLNEVNIYCGSYLPNWRPHADYQTLYSAVTEMGGGVHLDLIHELDYTYYFFGPPLKSYSLKKKVSALETDSFDSAVYVLDYKGFVVNICLNYFRRIPKREIELVFDDDIMKINLLENSVYKNERLEKKFENTIMDTYNEQMKYFFEFIKNHNAQEFNSLKEAVEVLKICLHE